MGCLRTLFSFSGRSRRRGLLLGTLLSNALLWALLVFFGGIAGMVAARQGMDPRKAGMLVREAFAWATMPVLAWINAALIVKRLHDLGWSGWHAAWFIPCAVVLRYGDAARTSTPLALAMLLIKILATGLALLLFFRRGEAAENASGPPASTLRQAPVRT